MTGRGEGRATAEEEADPSAALRDDKQGLRDDKQGAVRARTVYFNRASALPHPLALPLHVHVRCVSCRPALWQLPERLHRAAAAAREHCDAPVVLPGLRAYDSMV